MSSFTQRHPPLGGYLVHLHEVVEKAGSEVFRCSLSGRTSDWWLEVPAWMFDRAASAAWRVSVTPHVDIAALHTLVTLMQDVTPASGPYRKQKIRAQHWVLTTRIEEMLPLTCLCRPG